MGLANLPWLYWNRWLEAPLAFLKEAGLDYTTGWPLIAYKVIVTILLAAILLELLTRLRRLIAPLLWKDDFTEADTVVTGPKEGLDARVESLEAARNLERTIRPLKKARRYDRMAEVYASLNMHKDAAKWFSKAGDRKLAAMEWALAGDTKKAAALLVKEGDYATAARFYEEVADYRDAAATYEKAGHLAKAAAAYAHAGMFVRAVQAFEQYFEGTEDPPQAQCEAAEACFAVLESEPGREKIGPEERASLLPHLAVRFGKAQRYDIAAQLFLEAGDATRASDIFIRAGRLQDAAKCMHDAGRPKEARQIAGRYFETQGRWAEAGAAHAASDDVRRAGDCFAKANDFQHAAECYEKAEEFYGAGLACSHLGRFEHAIRLLQRLKESDPMFDPSRALLGRCFYELHDYAHCAATLANHLTGKRVETGNLDYYYMLALAYEQLGKLEESQGILLNIKTLSAAFKDVALRLSNISSRISMGADPVTAPGTPASGLAETKLMTMVADQLGGRYRLERELGRGGMGVVYLARDTQLDRPVALKFLGSLIDQSEKYRQRFVREAKAAARVNHPNIISIYDVSATAGKAYIAMEYVEGPSLHRYVRAKDHLAPRKAVNLIIQICSALGAIHKAGIVHRDIKPDNILIAKGGLAKLTDFGLAKAEQARSTGAVVVMGTPSYMSPELTLGSDVDARSDLYSLGLVFHEMLTGHTAFTGENLVERQRTETPPPPSALVEGIPEALDRIVMKCIEKDPAKRFQTAEELNTTLRDMEV